MRLAPHAFASSLALVSAGAWAADPVPSLDLRSFRPPVDPAGQLYLEPSATPGPGNWNVGAYASYALSPVVLDDARGNELARVVAHQVSVDYFAGLGLGQRWAVGLVVPTILYQSGDDAGDVLPGSTELPHTALGDVAALGKFALVVPADLGGLGLALLGRVDLPTGNTKSYASDAGVRGELRALGELNLLALGVGVTAGYRVRSEPQTFLRDGTDDYRFGGEIPWGAGVTLRPQALGIDREGHFRWAFEAHGAIATTPALGRSAQSPVLGAASARYTTGEVSLLFGAEFPLNDAVGNPLVRPVLSFGWAPRFEDADQDEVEDEADECPELAEDRDGHEDADGCPDFDNDDDGVSDDSDKCPKEQEDTDEFQDEDGCADPDNDGDAILDTADGCPLEKGMPETKGCPDPDPDRDGVPRERDKCPDAAEDPDGHADEDGCPDPDDDGDGVLDAKDACPGERGEANPAAELDGCVVADHDGDTYDDASDKCPAEAEDFDGAEDDDGCPDERAGAPYFTISDVNGAQAVEWKKPPRIVKDDVDPKTLPSLRALARELNLHPTWIAAVGARPDGAAAAAEQAAMNRAFAVTLTLRWLTHRDGAAEVVGWAAVRDLPAAGQRGFGVLVLSPKPAGRGP